MRFYTEFSGGFTLNNIPNPPDFCGFEGGKMPSLGLELFPAYVVVKMPCRGREKSSSLWNGLFPLPLKTTKMGQQADREWTLFYNVPIITHHHLVELKNWWDI